MLNFLVNQRSALTGDLLAAALDTGMVEAMHAVLATALKRLIEKLSQETCGARPHSVLERELLSQQRVAVRWLKELGILAKQEQLRKQAG